MSDIDTLTFSDVSTSSSTHSGERATNWYEDVAVQVFDAAEKETRLEKLIDRMQATSYFDGDDVTRVREELEQTREKLAAIHEVVSKSDWKLVTLFITLRRREAFLEQAVSDRLLHPEEDEELFSEFVKKQVYLTRLASEKVYQPSSDTQ